MIFQLFSSYPPRERFVKLQEILLILGPVHMEVGDPR